MDTLKYHPGPSCPTSLWPAGGPPLKRPYGRLRGGPPTGRVACSRLLPPWTPHTILVCVVSHPRGRRKPWTSSMPSTRRSRCWRRSTCSSPRRHSRNKLGGLRHGRLARGCHGLPKVSLGPAMSYPSTPCRRATPETTLRPFQREVAHPKSWRSPAIFFHLGHPTPYAYGVWDKRK
jgi:hypothetical protein